MAMKKGSFFAHPVWWLYIFLISSDSSNVTINKQLMKWLFWNELQFEW